MSSLTDSSHLIRLNLMSGCRSLSALTLMLGLAWTSPMNGPYGLGRIVRRCRHASSVPAPPRSSHTALNSPSYDVAPDGERFLVIAEMDEELRPSQINVVLDWSEELERLVPKEK